MLIIFCRVNIFLAKGEYIRPFGAIRWKLPQKSEKILCNLLERWRTAISRGRFRRLLVSDKYVSLNFYVKNLKKHRTRSNHTRRPWRSPARRAQADLGPRLDRLPHERGNGS